MYFLLLISSGTYTGALPVVDITRKDALMHLPGGQGPQVRDPLVLVQSTRGFKEQPPLLTSHSLMSTQENPFPEKPDYNLIRH